MLPALLAPKIPGASQPGGGEAGHSRAWRKALTNTENRAADGTLPPLPDRHSPPAVP